MPTPKRTEQEREFVRLLGQLVRVTRRAKKLKAEGLAYDLGVTQQTISALELGKAVPSWSTLFKLSRVLGMPVWQMVRHAEDRIGVASVFEQSARRIAEHERDQGLQA